jgi:hypothetical protein
VGPLIIEGRVVTGRGEPVAAAAVYLAGGPVALPDVAQLTGPDGRFAFAVPAAGCYRVGVNAPGQLAREEEVTVGEGARAAVEVRIDAPGGDVPLGNP